MRTPQKNYCNNLLLHFFFKIKLNEKKQNKNEEHNFLTKIRPDPDYDLILIRVLPDPDFSIKKTAFWVR